MRQKTLELKKFFPYKLYQLIGINDPSIHEGCAENLFLINIAQMTGQRGFGISREGHIGLVKGNWKHNTPLFQA